jgi:Ni/Fe-hydrogenase b-type cytochrome subunit
MKTDSMATNQEYQHPFIVRLTHWVNFIALGIMVTSGLRIYNASPIFDFRIPDVLTLGDWLAGARQWHFFGMWLFVFNGIVWIFYNIFSKHGRRTTMFRASDVQGLLPMIQYYLRIRKEHPPYKKYNTLQKLAYTTIPLAALGAILSGIAIYWPVQFSWVTAMFGQYEAARVWHFIFTAVLVLFFFGHLFMVTNSGWDNFVSIITGWKRTQAESSRNE